MNWTGIALFIQLFFGIIIGLYFWNLLKNQRHKKFRLIVNQKKKWNNYEKCDPFH